MSDFYIDIPINDIQMQFFANQQSIVDGMLNMLLSSDIPKDTLIVETQVLHTVKALGGICQLSPFTLFRIACMYSMQAPSEWIRALQYAKATLPSASAYIRLPIYHGLDYAIYLAETRFLESRNAKEDDILLPFPSHLKKPEYQYLFLILKDEKHIRAIFHNNDGIDVLGELIG